MTEYNKHNVVISKIISWAIIFAIVFDMLNQLSFFLVGRRYFSLLIDGLSWIILTLLIYWISRYFKRFLLLKILILVTAIKFIYYALTLHQYSFQKGILIVLLLSSMLFYNEEFRKITCRIINRYKYVLLVLFLLTFMPFIGSYSPRVYRISALWDLPHSAAYYFLAFMFLIGKNNSFISSIFSLLIITTGVRSAIIPASIYLGYVFSTNIKKSLSTKRKLGDTFSTLFGILLLLALFFHPNLKFFRERLVYHLSPIFTESILDPSYGKGRTVLHMYLFEEVKNFNTFEFFFGRSATSMWILYEHRLDVRIWPHDDFATTLYIYGIIGLILYLYYLFVLPLRRMPPNRSPKIILLGTTIFILALVNGFYTYLSSYLFILIFAVLYEENRCSCSNS